MINNTIEREVFINARLERVWSLVSKTGFWVGEEVHFEHDLDEGEQVTIDVPKYGSFPVKVMTLDKPRYAAYRWASGSPGEEPDDSNSTLVEFTLTERDGGVLLHMKESGFATITGDPNNYRDNSKGWVEMLDKLVAAAEEAAVR